MASGKISQGFDLVKNYIAWNAVEDTRVSTSLTSYIMDTLPTNGALCYRWSSSGNSTAVGAPSADSYHYLILKNVSAVYILALKMSTTAKTAYMKQYYANEWGNWVSLSL